MEAQSAAAGSGSQDSATRTTGSNPMSLDGRVVIVTGAAQGIGLAIAKLVADLGAAPVMIDRDGDALVSASRLVGEKKCLVLAGDVTDPAFAPEVVEKACERFGGVRGLVNNAGIGSCRRRRASLCSGR